MWSFLRRIVNKDTFLSRKRVLLAAFVLTNAAG